MKSIQRPFLFTALILSISFFVACNRSTKPQADAEDLKTLDSMLHKQVQAWNRGDIDGFMSYYHKSDSLIFMSSKRRMNGWDSLHASYKKSFPNLESMGNLTFSELNKTLISNDLANVTGVWKLERNKDTLGGTFSLICRFQDEKWTIIMDHTW